MSQAEAAGECQAAPRATRRVSGGDAMLFLCVLTWSVNVSVVKILLGHYPPFVLAALRVCEALLGFAVVLLLRRESIGVRLRDLPLLVAAGLIGIFMNQFCFVYALRLAHASSVALLLSMIPVFVVITAAVLGVADLSKWALAGIPISVFGVLMIIATEPGNQLSLGSLSGNIFAIGTSLSWAVYTVIIQPLLKRYSVAKISVYVLLVGLVALAPAALAGAHGPSPAAVPWWAWLLVVFSGLGAIFATNFLWYIGTHRLGPARGSLYAFLQPFLGALAAVVILADAVNPLEVVGGAVVIAGIIMARREKPAATELAAPGE
ncbi:MAG TPA: DMT family transporter [Chloroflexota bacterium]|nr:DMT family transporter [Chloroflexota bacterium]